MIWHIFKKDMRLSWRLALAVAALHWVTPVIMMTLSDSARGRGSLSNLLGILLLAGPLATGFLLIIVVQHDAIPGVRQDWLVRPIRRRDLMLAKLLFAALAVQLPIFLADLTALFVSGYSPTSSISVAIQQSVLQMLVINLPFLALGSMTRNLLEMISGGVVLGFAVAIVDALTSGTPFLEPLVRTGLSWIMDSAEFAVLAVGASAVLMLAYLRRRTAFARTLTGGVAALCLLAWFIPWRPAFAVQKLLSTEPDSSGSVALDFDPAAGRFRPPAGALTPDDALKMLLRDQGAIQVYLPIRVAGLPHDSAIQMDYAEARLIANGKIERLTLERWNARSDESGNPKQWVFPAFGIPAATYTRVKDQHVRLEVDHWLTLAQVVSSQAIPAIDADLIVPGVGRCRTKLNAAETAVQLSCAAGVTIAACFNSFLEHVPTGQRNPNQFGCGTYAPVVLSPVLNPALIPFAVNFPFRDPSALAQFPVDGSKLRSSRAVFQRYRVLDHFTRKLVIPDVRLSDWLAETPGS